MRIGVLGTGVVGCTIASKLVEIHHDVMMGSRTAHNDNAAAWTKVAGDRSSAGTFGDAAAYGELVFNCTSGSGSVAALTAAGANNLEHKVLVDVSNPLDFSNGFPPTLMVCNSDSLAEQLQRLIPKAHVVKAFNTMTAALMVNPALVAGQHNVFLAGNEPGAKDTVRGLMGDMGWTGDRIIDLGDIMAARGLEMFLPLWLQLMGATGSPNFNIAVLQG